MNNDLKTLVKKYPACIPISAVAEFLRMSPASLRASIEQGRCPFGFSWKHEERAGFKIPTTTFVAWYTKGVPVSVLTF